VIKESLEIIVEDVGFGFWLAHFKPLPLTSKVWATGYTSAEALENLILSTPSYMFHLKLTIISAVEEEASVR